MSCWGPCNEPLWLPEQKTESQAFSSNCSLYTNLAPSLPGHTSNGGSPSRSSCPLPPACLLWYQWEMPGFSSVMLGYRAEPLRAKLAVCVPSRVDDSVLSTPTVLRHQLTALNLGSIRPAKQSLGAPIWPHSPAARLGVTPDAPLTSAVVMEPLHLTAWELPVRTQMYLFPSVLQSVSTWRFLPKG